MPVEIYIKFPLLYKDLFCNSDQLNVKSIVNVQIIGRAIIKSRTSEVDLNSRWAIIRALAIISTSMVLLLDGLKLGNYNPWLIRELSGKLLSL